MSFTATNSTKVATPFASDGKKFQILTFKADPGDTSGTVTADGLHEMQHLYLPASLTNTAAATFSGNVATLAFTVPSHSAAALTLQGITYTAVDKGDAGNSITIAYTSGGTAGAEVVTVSGAAISIQIESGVSTRTQVRTAFNLSAEAAALATATGTSATAATTVGATPLTGGVSYYGTCLAVGR
jgi:hypothetical protein